MAEPAPAPGAADLKELSLDALRRMAKEHKLIGFSRLRKADLVDTLRRLLEEEALRKAQQPRPAKLATHGEDSVAAPAPVASGPAAQPAETKGPAAPAGDPGSMRDPAWNPPELPSTYGKDRLTLMVRDPHWLFCYWEVTPALLGRVRQEFTGNAWQVLRVHLLDDQERVVDGWEEGIPEGTVNWYLQTGRPGARFRAELGLTDATGRYRVLVASNTVRSPMDAPSGRWDEEWVGLSREEWERLERAARPFPGSLMGLDMIKRELHLMAAAKVGGSDLAPPPSGKKASKP